MSQVQETPNVENRLLAALAHGSVITQGLGILVGVLVYVNQREKSRYAAFQALQAAVYQLVTLLFIVALWFLWGAFYAITFIPIIQNPEFEDAPPPLFWIGMGSMVVPFVFMLVFGLYGLWAALRTWQGRDFRYPLIGGWLERSGLWREERA